MLQTLLTDKDGQCDWPATLSDQDSNDPEPKQKSPPEAWLFGISQGHGVGVLLFMPTPKDPEV